MAYDRTNLKNDLEIAAHVGAGALILLYLNRGFRERCCALLVLSIMFVSRNRV
jgi:hypothetical protein